MKMTKKWMFAILILIAAIVAALLFSARPTSTKSNGAINLTGSGSTFAIPLLDACKAGYSTATGNSYTYTGGGSGAGRTASDKGINDFNFSDTPHTAATRLATVIHLPVIAAPIAVMYKLNLAQPLKLSASTIAGIFGGTITKWNDAAIVGENVGVTLPATTIHVIYRSDASGTTGNFTNFLHGMAPGVWTNAGSNDFKSGFPGTIDSSANLGRIVGAAGSSGATALAATTPDSITYAEKSYAKAAGLSIANIKNAAGNYQTPNAAGTSAFLGAATVNANGYLTFKYDTKIANAYPLGIVSYALVDTKSKNSSALKAFLSYILDSKCPTSNPSLEYATITGPLLSLDLAQIAKIGKA
jgi:phosphate transport system substrate-binding protein